MPVECRINKIGEGAHMSDNREIVVQVSVNGKPMVVASETPLRRLQISVSTRGHGSKEEVKLQFGLNLDSEPPSFQAPDVKPPDSSII
jgi:hypothetical protein